MSKEDASGRAQQTLNNSPSYGKANTLHTSYEVESKTGHSRKPPQAPRKHEA